MRRFLTWAAAVLLLVAVAAAVGVGWYYSGEILTVERPAEADYDTEVVAVDRRTVTLEATDEALRPGTWGIDAPEAYAQAGPIVAQDGDTVTRRLTTLDGRLLPGDAVDVDGYAYPQDPDAAFDFEVEQVAVPAPLGRQPAWLVEGGPSRWAILVHGRAARANECFRMLPILHARDMTSLCVSYRNDVGGAADAAGIYRQGAREWEDVEAAVSYALERGAEDVVLVGYSMGGQITANLLRRSELADEVDGAIWDSPLLDWGPVLNAAAEDRGVPTWVVPLGMQASEWRAGVDYAELNQVAHADEFDVPILLFHGTDDGTVPVTVADEFAAARDDIVTYVRVPDVGHVQAWNADPAAYADAVDAFLDQALNGD